MSRGKARASTPTSPALGGALVALVLSALAAPALADSADATPPAAAAAAPVPRPRKVIVEPPPPTPDPAAVEAASEANLESTGPRSGMAFGAFFMGWQQVGTVDDSGRGGGLGLRVGRSAASNTVIWLELVAGAFPGESTTKCNMTSTNPNCLSHIESNAALAVTAQRYVGPNTWLRGGAGFATYTQVNVHLPDRNETREARAGLGAVAGLGVDLVRRHQTRLSLESMVTVQRFSEGWIFDLGFGVGVALY